MPFKFQIWVYFVASKNNNKLANFWSYHIWSTLESTRLGVWIAPILLCVLLIAYQFLLPNLANGFESISNFGYSYMGIKLVKPYSVPQTCVIFKLLICFNLLSCHIWHELGFSCFSIMHVCGSEQRFYRDCWITLVYYTGDSSYKDRWM